MSATAGAPIDRLFDPAEVVERAQQRAGVVELGPDSFREGLELLCRSLEPFATGPGAGTAATLMVDGLANRLRVHNYARRHPEVRAAAITRPLFVLGLPRSGTTLVSYLLDQDPARRSLLLWESLDSVPPPTTATLHTDPRCLALLRAQERQAALDPSRIQLHAEWADGPTECLRLHLQEFKSISWGAYGPAAAYLDWLLDADLTSAYQYERLALQVLQSHAPGPWSLKQPSHALFVDALLTVFPDARLVWTHRDPFRAAGSLFSMMTRLWRRNAGVDGRTLLQEHYPRQLAEHLNRPMRARARIGHDRIYDLHYAEMLRDPIGTLRRLYDWAGDTLSAEAERAMLDWLARNPQGRFGRHEYTLKEYGVSRAQLEPWFADYLAAYDIESEGSE